MMRTARCAPLALVFAALLVAEAGCGVPTDGQASSIPASDVPYGLAFPSASRSAAPVPVPRLDGPRVYLLGQDAALVPRGRAVTALTGREGVQQLLTALADGPAPEELQEGLSSSLPPGMTLRATAINGGAVTVDIAQIVQAPAGWRSRLAVAQIVLTATSVPGVTAVVLTYRGAPLEAPLPSGQLREGPLTAQDYGPMTAPISPPR